MNEVTLAESSFTASINAPIESYYKIKIFRLGYLD